MTPLIPFTDASTPIVRFQVHRFIFLAALLTQPVLVANSAQAAPGGVDSTLTLAKIKGRVIAPVCPTLAKLRTLMETNKGRWTDASIGCGYVTPGNFVEATIVADSAPYVLVRFTRRKEESTRSWMYRGGVTRELWTPRVNYTIKGSGK